MKSRKKNLIEALHGSFMFIENLPDLIEKENIYNENGYVDLNFLTAILEYMQRAAATSLRIQQALNKLLGIEELEENNKKNKNDSGSKWSAEEILRHCTLEDNVLKLPQVSFNRKSYAEAKKWIEEAGGSWQGGKIQGFTFPFNAQRVFSILQQGKRCNLQQEYQFFSTPSDVADWLVMLAGGVDMTDKVLEPSAGTGAIIDAIHRNCMNVIVDCYELMPENIQLLQKKENINILGEDFIASDIKILYDKIIANPPFSKNQDIRHVRRMYDCVKKGGVVAAIMGTHWKLGNEIECVKFREWIDEIDAKIYNIDKGEFKESGTSIETTAVVIKK